MDQTPDSTESHPLAATISGSPVVDAEGQQPPLGPMTSATPEPPPAAAVSPSTAGPTASASVEIKIEPARIPEQEVQREEKVLSPAARTNTGPVVDGGNEVPPDLAEPAPTVQTEMSSDATNLPPSTGLPPDASVTVDIRPEETSDGQVKDEAKAPPKVLIGPVSVADIERAPPLPPAATAAPATEPALPARLTDLPSKADPSPDAPHDASPEEEGDLEDEDLAPNPVDKGKQKADELDDLSVNYVMTSEDAYAVIDGTLYVSDLDKGNWVKTDYDNVRRLRYGMDQRVYILTKDNKLIQPQVTHRAASPQPVINLPSNVTDFAISITGSVAFVTPDRPGEIGILAARGPSAPGEKIDDLSNSASSKIRWIKGPEDHDIESIVFKQTGELVLADRAGDLYIQPYGATTWTKEREPGTERGKARKLLVLRGGAIGVVNQDGALFTPKEHEHHTEWLPGEHATPAQIEQFFSRFNSRMDTETWKRFVLAIPGGPSLHSRKDSNEGHWIWRHVVPRFFKPDYEGQNLPRRWQDWYSAHPLMQRSASHRSATHKEEYLTEVQQKFQALRNFVDSAAPQPDESIPLQDRAPRDDQLRALGQAAAVNAKIILDRLEEELGSNRADFRTSVHYPKVYSRALARSESNSLYILQQTYKKARLESDPVMQQLDQMLDKGIYLDVSSARKEGGIKNTWGVWTSKLLCDAELLTRQKGDFPADASGTAHQPVEFLDGHWPGHDNNITTMYQLGFQNTDRVEKFFDEIANFNNAMKLDNHKIQRAMSAQGQLLEIEKTDPGIQGDELKRLRNEAFLDHLNSMEVGQQVQLAGGNSYGIDAEGWSQFLKAAPDRDFNKLVTLQKWAFEPLLSVGPRSEHSVTWTRTADGFDVTFGRDNTVQAMAGVKSQHGIGVHPNNGKWLFFMYAGINVKAQVQASRQVKTDFVASLKFDESGTVQTFLEKMIDGEIDVYTLATMSKGIANTRTTIDSGGPKVDIEPLLATGLLVSTSANPFDTRFKLIGAPIVHQINFDGKGERTTVHTVSAQGESTRSKHWLFPVTIAATNIAVLEGQYGQTRDIPNMTGPGTIKQGYENQYKLPFHIMVWGRELYNKYKVKRDGYELIDNGTDSIELKSLQGTVSVSNAPTNSFTGKDKSVDPMRSQANVPNNTDFNERNIPELNKLAGNTELLEEINKLVAANLPLSVTRELTPKGGAAIREKINNAKTDQDRSEIQMMLDDPKNSQITEISTLDTLGYDTGSNLGFFAFRIFSSARSDFSPARKVVKITYGNDGTPSFTTSGTRANSEKLYGKENMSDIRGLRRLIETDLLPLLLDPIGNDKDRELHAPFVNDVLDNLRRAKVFHMESLGDLENTVLGKFFPARNDEEPFNKELVAFTLENPQALNQFKTAVRVATDMRLREPIAQHDSVTLLQENLPQRAISNLMNFIDPAPVPAPDPIVEFLKNPTKSDDPAIAAERAVFLPYISRIMDDHKKGSADSDFRSAAIKAYFHNGEVTLDRIIGDPENLAEFQKSIQRCYQQLESDREEIHNFLTQLKGDRERLAMVEPIKAILKLHHANRTRPQDNDREEISKFFPSPYPIIATIASPLTTMMNEELLRKIMSDPVTFQLFDKALDAIVKKENGKELHEAKDRVLAGPSRITGGVEIQQQTASIESSALRLRVTTSAPASASASSPRSVSGPGSVSHTKPRSRSR
jgi:hypothetical protein